MKIDINVWMAEFLRRLKDLFGSRLEFVGLQGSYGRGEATDDSDIDAVVILDRAASEDIKAYGDMVSLLPNCEKACGFISGRKEIVNWERSDVFQFFYDTAPVYGSIDYLKELICTDDVRRAVRIGACNIYHMCGHNMAHEKDVGLLKALYKAAAFSVQAIAFLQTGIYRKQKSELLAVVGQRERKILETAISLKPRESLGNGEFDLFSGELLLWVSDLISEYGPDETVR